MRLIDADAYADKMREKQNECKELINEAGDNLSDRIYWKGVFSTFVESKLTLDDTPTVDAVPIIRVARLLSDTFSNPCNFSPIDEEMMEICGDCCDMNDERCWERWLKHRLECKRREGDDKA